MRSNHQWTGVVFRLVDVAIIVCAWFAAYWVRFVLEPFFPALDFPPLEIYAALAPLAAALWLVVFGTMRVYESRRMVGLVDDLRIVMKAHGLSLLYFVTLTYLFEHYRYSRLVMGYFGVISAAAIVVSRYGIRSALRKLRQRGYNVRRVLIVGDSRAARMLITRFRRFPELGLRVIGVLSERSATAPRAQKTVAGRPLLGRFDEVRDVIQRCEVDEVLIALPDSQQRHARGILDLIKDEPVSVGLVPDVQSYVTLGCRTEDMDGVPIVRINDSSLDALGALAKRGTDIALSLLALLLLAPPLVLIAVLVKLTSPGPVLFNQERMGLDGRTFQMLKFRSMRVDAESQTGAVWAKEADARRTWFGSLLRRTSLDELPQFWNVLVGDMSLVGPRPERPVFVHQFRDQIPHYMLRHKVKAGITGWAQVNGWRGNTSLDRRIEHDLFYIRNWSYGLDLKILTMTLWRGFINKNAY